MDLIKLNPVTHAKHLNLFLVTQAKAAAALWETCKPGDLVLHLQDLTVY